jgi:poly(hydroxyalkanoate) depolymerase family esterase
MNALPKIDMTDAARLARRERLAKAMALVRSTLANASSWAPHANVEGDAQHRPSERMTPILDIVRRSMETANSWMPTQLGKAPSGGGPGGMGEPCIPEAIRGLLDSLGQLGSAPQLDGLRPKVARPVAPLPAGATFEERQYSNQAGSRTYKLYVPSGYDGQALPLVVMLHGCTQSPDDFAAGTRMNELAEEQIFLVAYPAQPQSANASKCWNWFSAADQQRDQGEPSLLAGITRQIIRDFAVDPGRVYVAGLSAGGAAAAIMGSTYPDLYAAIGVHSGLACGAARDVPSAFAAMRQGGSMAAANRGGRAAVPTIVFHGDRDTTVSPVNGNQVIAQAKAAADLRGTVSRGETPRGVRYTCTVQADESGRPMLEQWVLHEVGHAWSGGSAAGSYTEPRGPDASREMMRFFLQHSTSAASIS